MEHNSTLEADSRSAAPEIPHLMEPEGSLLFSQEPAIEPYPEPEDVPHT